MVGSLIPVDVCDLLRIDLLQQARAENIPLDAACTPLPDDLEDRLPLVWLTCQGGSRTGMVMDRFTVTLGVYAASWSESMRMARTVMGILLGLPYDADTLAQWRDVQTVSLPYEDPDPDHPTVPRTSMTVTVCVRAGIQDDITQHKI